MVAGSQVITPTAENAIIRQSTHKTIYTKLVLTTFMLKKRDFILRLCRKSLRGRRFVTRKITEKNERWTVSPLKKSRADSVLPGRPLFCISASLSPQRCFFYFSLNSLKFELNARLLSFSFFSVENSNSRFLGAFPDPPSREFSAVEWTRPLTKLNSNGESALIL